MTVCIANPTEGKNDVDDDAGHRATKGSSTRRNRSLVTWPRCAGQGCRVEGSGPWQAWRDARPAHDRGRGAGAAGGPGVAPERLTALERRRGQHQQVAHLTDLAAEQVRAIRWLSGAGKRRRAAARRRGFRATQAMDGCGNWTRRGPGRIAVPQGIVRAPLRLRRVPGLCGQTLLLDAQPAGGRI